MDYRELMSKKNNKGWADNIEESDIFLVLGTEDYFKDATCLMQTKHAAELGKTFLVALQKDVAIPLGYFEGVKSIRIFKWEDKKELFDITEKIIAEYFV
ncbi:hypothetical protein LCGC14_1861920 [marine sediment metagenome]|uniref:TIR domain-containing protein n=1 Tax=marine sediment metagenome TaxID=412755 RepID=A0A0F9GVN0_9ZZZZ